MNFREADEQWERAFFNRWSAKQERLEDMEEETMPAMIMKIKKESFGEGLTFIVEMFEYIGQEPPTDVWEVRDIIVDDETMQFLTDKAIDETFQGGEMDYEKAIKGDD